MVDQSECSTNRLYPTETIRFRVSTKALDRGLLTSLYVEKRFSTKQIAEQLGCSKAFVIITLKRAGLLRRKGEAMTLPDNYRCHQPPYGHKVVGGKLVLHPGEIKVCRHIIDLIDRRGLNYLKTGQRLVQEGVKNRRGTFVWHNYTVRRIYDRWKDKL